MIHYHGIPMTPDSAAAKILAGAHAFVSFAHPQQLPLVIEVCQSFALDNGAFSAWKSGNPMQDWSAYYSWVRDAAKSPGFDFAVVPDCIDGGEKENDDLLAEWPLPRHQGAAVWHMHESLDRLRSLRDSWPRICIGSSGDFSQVGNRLWWGRMARALRELCDERGRPSVKFHGLRMLNPAIFSRIPFSSADSTNVARNIGLDNRWKGTYTPPNKEVRGIVIRARIEAANSPAVWDFSEEETLTAEDLL